MASPTIDITVATPTANSYVDVAYVNTYSQTAIDGDPWTALEDNATRIVLILRACKLLDTRAYYPGRTVQPTQNLQWPRIWVAHPSAGYYQTDTIPTCVKDAQAQLALYLAMTSTNTFGPLDTANFDQLSVGPVSITFSQRASAEGMAYFNAVIIPILESGNCVNVGARLVR